MSKLIQLNCLSESCALVVLPFHNASPMERLTSNPWFIYSTILPDTESSNDYVEVLIRTVGNNACWVEVESYAIKSIHLAQVVSGFTLNLGNRQDLINLIELYFDRRIMQRLYPSKEGGSDELPG